MRRLPPVRPSRVRRGTLACVVALAGLGGAAQLAHAQSLLEVYDTARGYDATYLASRALAQSAEFRAEQAHALRRPNIGLQASVARTRADVPSSDTTQRNGGAAVSGTQQLFNRANDAQISQADLSLDVARADLEIAEQDLILRVSQAYFDVLAAQDALETAKAARSAISEQLASAKRNFEVGTATITDTREAQARADLTTAQELAADNDLRVKRIALDQLVGRSNVEPRPLAQPVALPGVLPDSVDAWVSQTDTSPSVRKAGLGYDIAKLETEKARAGHLPTVEFGASYGRGHTDVTGSQLSTATGTFVPVDGNGPTTQSNIGVTLRVPLFAGFAVQNRVKETLQLEEQQRNNLDGARRAVAQATRQAFFGTQSLQAQVKALEAAESSSQLALEATQLGYRVGVRVNVDVLNAQTQLYSTRRDLARARYDVLLTQLRLRQAAGQLKADDIRAINALLAP
jgi:outer membrane protein